MHCKHNDQTTADLSGNMSTKPSVCAIVVAYHPDDRLNEQIGAVLPQVAKLVVVDNTPESFLRFCPVPALDPLWVEQIYNDKNLGLAKALNQGLQYAVRNDFEWILTLDQDTHCFADMVKTLVSIATETSEGPMIIGGNYFDPKRNTYEAPPGSTTGAYPRKTVITSGCLVNTRFASAIGGFHSEYFIDQLDHEFCLRARRHGGRVVISKKPVMTHSVGGISGPKIPVIGLTLPDHPPLRKYYITRNSIITVKAFWRSEPIWCTKRAARLLLGLLSMAIFEHDRITKLSAFAKGVVDGFRHRLGPCEHIFETIRRETADSSKAPRG